MAKLATLTEDFASPNGAKWPGYSDNAAFIQYTGGVARWYSVADFAGMDSVATDWDITGSSITLQIVTRTTKADGGIFGISFQTANGASNALGWTVSAADTGSFVDSGTGQVAVSHGITIPNPWLRISEASGTVTFAWSADGVSWQTLRTVATPTGLTGGQLHVYSGGAAVNNTTVSYTEIDNLNIAASTSTLAQWNFATTTLPSTLDSHWTYSDFTYTAGFTNHANASYGYATDPVLRIAPPSAASVSHATVVTTEYAEMTLTPTSGSTVTINGIQLLGARGAAGTPRGMAIRWSLDNFASEIWWADFQTVRPTMAAYSTGKLSATVTGPLAIRVYPWAPTTANTMEIDNLTIFGSVSAAAVQPSTVDGGTLGWSGASSLTGTAVVTTNTGALALSAATGLSASAGVVATADPLALGSTGGLSAAALVLADSGILTWSSTSGLSADGTASTPAAPVVDGGVLALSSATSLTAAGIRWVSSGSLAWSATSALSADATVVAAWFLSTYSGDADLGAASALVVQAELVITAGELDWSGQSGLDSDSTVYPIRYLFRSPTMRVPALCGTPFTRRLQTTVGVTVVRDDGFWREIAEPVDMGAYDVVYLGGYEHWISRAEYLELLDAGYGEYLTVLEPQVPLTPVSAGFGSSAFGSGPFGQDGIPYATGVYGENTYQETT